MEKKKKSNQEKKPNKNPSKTNEIIPSGFNLDDDKLEENLQTGENASLLIDYFGEAEYEELRSLAREASRRSVRGGPRVLILPGVMGSKLGTRRLALFRDLIWIDPVDVVIGNLDKLNLNPVAKKIVPMGVILLAYLKLKLRLKIAGFNATFFAYDWRLSLEQLGRSLARIIKKLPDESVYLVAHSMGGLVARAAMAKNGINIDSRVKKVIMMGTPNRGSFVPVEVIRAVQSTVRKLAAVDLTHSPYDLAEIFKSFPGLYQLLPDSDAFDEIDLYDIDNWPETGPQPDRQLLSRAKTVKSSIMDVDSRFYLIAGVNRETVVSVSRDGDEFVFERSPAGDGTVPLSFAQVPGLKTYFIDETHGSIPNNRKTAASIIDILNTGVTDVLPDEWQRSVRLPVFTRSESESVDEEPFGGRRGRELRQYEIRALIEEFVSPTSSDADLPSAISTPPPSSGPMPAGPHQQFNKIVVGRQRQRRIDINLAYGSIAEIDARAIVIGVFQNVAPSGPAKALDDRLGGAIAEFTRRRMFTGNVGEVFILPAARRQLQTEFILFVGLGSFESFSGDIQQLVAENVVRTLVRSNIEDFATVLMGAGSGSSSSEALANLLTGFVNGLNDSDRDHTFRKISLCETDPERYKLIKSTLFMLSGTDIFDGMEVTLAEEVLPEPPLTARVGAGIVEERDPAYLNVRCENLVKKGETVEKLDIRASLLTSGGKATVVTAVKTVSQTELDGHLDKLTSPGMNLARLEKFGVDLAKLVLPDMIRSVLATLRNYHLVVVHDAECSRIPWETVRVEDWTPSRTTGLSRRYAAENLALAKWLSQRQFGNTLDILLVVNPTGNLSGADDEGQRIRKIARDNPSLRITVFEGDAATKGALLSAFQSGKFDVIHYAGHAFFDASNPSRSGIKCSEEQILSGAELSGLRSLPGLIFSNACESAQIRAPSAGDDNVKDKITTRINENVGLAEAFLRGGVANYIGTHWPVGDLAAEAFATAFYGELLRGKTIGAAVKTAREKVVELRSIDWADYIHYGSHEFILKRPQ